MKKGLLFWIALAFSFNIYGQDLLSGGDNSWLLHTPDDGRRNLYIVPGQNGVNWNFASQIELNQLGNISIPIQRSLGHLNSSDVFQYDGKTVGNYSLGWYNDSWQGGAPSSYYSGYAGIKFFTQTAPRMAIDYMGNVGINTTSPEAKFHVAGNSILGSTYDTWTSFGASNGGRIRGSGEGYLVLSSNPNGSSDRNIYYITQPGYNHLMTGGKVGMGTNSPIANLDVYTELHTPSTFNTQSWTNSNSAYSLSLQTVWDNDGINQRIVQKFNGTNYTSLSFFKGNVGIGTTTPTSKLTVDGKINCEEVKVEIIAGTGPDYVFEPTYNLPTLAETEAYIRDNKHLPEVPSAKEMEANGINLSEMNMLLLKKVEELTLYTIELNKKFEQLKYENEVLKSVNKKQDAILNTLVK